MPAAGSMSSSAIQQVRYQTMSPAPRGTSDDVTQPVIQLEPPGPLRVFQLDTEAKLQERMRQEARERPTTEPAVQFPAEPKVTGGAIFRNFAPQTEVVEPNYVCYGRLYFEDKNSERYGWDLGFIQPVVSTGLFFWDLAALPYNICAQPCWHFESSAGYCLPGDAVPYLLYPPNLSVTGVLGEASTAVALLAIFP